MYDILIIGGGPAGVTAALRARELGAEVALVERGRMGGTCTNDGCVPTRALAKAARLVRDAGQFSEYGLTGEAPKVDYARLIARTQQIVYQIQEKKQLIRHLEAQDIRVFSEVGEARFVDPHTITIPGGTRLQAEQFILCVGGKPRRLGFPGAENALTHSDVWTLKSLPERVAIVGAAATGCQLASIFADFGSRVWLLDIAPRILPAEDEEVARAMATSFGQQGIEIVTGIGGIDAIEVGGGHRPGAEADQSGRPRPPNQRTLARRSSQGGSAKSATLRYNQHDQPHSLEVDAVILAVGWPGNLEALDLPAASVRVEGGFIPVDPFLRTSTPHIYAAGDITGRMMLVQSAGYEARIAAENAVLGPAQTYEHLIVPHGGFTDPEYGSVGLTEAEARQNGEITVATIPYADLDRAVIDGHPDGFCKLIASRPDGRILGAHVVGEQAVEVVQLVSAGMASGISVGQLAGLELAYPTYTAIVGLAARQLARDLGLLPLAPAWRALKHIQPAEWERSESGPGTQGPVRTSDSTVRLDR